VQSVTLSRTIDAQPAAVTDAMDVAVVGGLLDATMIGRQRRRELAAQLDWLEAVCESGED